ncbi:MAG: PilZ domain-containing protein [Gammaproteobacteria bacterium]|nr:PilZ domain-containing protein [Gammaproteobacteria bacterium]
MKERRVHPRFDVILPANVTVGDNRVDGNIFDISMGGIQIGCDQASAAVIVPTPNQHVHPGANLEAVVSFRCPGDDMRLTANCRLVVSRRVSSNEFRIGLEFIEFGDDRQRQTYEAYIEERMAELA